MADKFDNRIEFRTNTDQIVRISKFMEAFDLEKSKFDKSKLIRLGIDVVTSFDYKDFADISRISYGWNMPLYLFIRNCVLKFIENQRAEIQNIMSYQKEPPAPPLVDVDDKGNVISIEEGSRRSIHAKIDKLPDNIREIAKRSQEKTEELQRKALEELG